MVNYKQGRKKDEERGIVPLVPVHVTGDGRYMTFTQDKGVKHTSCPSVGEEDITILLEEDGELGEGYPNCDDITMNVFKRRGSVRGRGI